MPTSIPRIKIFLSSPGDVAVERANARDVIKRLNNDPLIRNIAHIKIEAWDDPSSRTPMISTLSPQEAINRGMPTPGECDIVIVILWARMGTPLPKEFVKTNGDKFLSGTEWEYINASESAETSGSPTIVVYHRTEEPIIKLSDPDIDGKRQQLKRVKNFLKSFSDSEGSIIKGINEYKNPDEFTSILENDLKQIIKHLLESPDNNKQFDYTSSIPTSSNFWRKNRSPFPGLRAFTEEDSEIFFGRGHEIDELIKLIRDSKTRFLSVAGASGSGKSSLIRAGLIPTLMKNAIPGSKDWLYCRFTPGEINDNPMTALCVQLASFVEDTPNNIHQSLTQDVHYVASLCTQILKKYPEWAELVLFIDQFEELFTLSSDEYRQIFIDLLATMATIDNLRIVITIRSDFLPRCIQYPVLAELLNNGTYLLSAPDQKALYKMIAEPAKVAQLDFEGELAWDILEDTGTEPGALALMAYTLDELYKKCVVNNSDVMTSDYYHQLEGVRGAIGLRAEQVYSQLDPDVQSALPIVFSRLVNVGEDGTISRRYANQSEFSDSEAEQSLIDALIDARLLFSNIEDRREAYVEVAHEALFTHWKRLDEWIMTIKDDLQLLDKVSVAASEWTRKDYPDYYLWSHERLVPVYSALSRLLDIKREIPDDVMNFIKPEANRLLEEFRNDETPEYRRYVIVDRLDQFGTEGVTGLIYALWAALGENTPEELQKLIFTKLQKYPETAISRFVEYADSEDLNTRSFGIWALGNIGNDEMCQIILDKLDDPDPDVRKWSTWSLGQIGCKEAISQLAQKCLDEVEDVSIQAIMALGKIGGKEATHILLDLMDRDESTRISVEVSIALSKTSQLDVIPIYVEALDHSKKEIRSFATRQLGNIGEAHVVDALIEVLSDTDLSVRKSAIEALGKLKVPRSIPALVNIQDDRELRYEAGKALDEFMADDIPDIINLFDTFDEDQIQTIIVCLKRIGNKNIDAIVEATKTSTTIKYRSLIQILAELPVDKSIDLLKESLFDGDPLVRLASAQGLGKASDEDLIPIYERALADTSIDVRRQIVSALDKLSSPMVVPLLVRALNDDDKEIRLAAIRSLAKYEGSIPVTALIDNLKDPNLNIRQEISRILIANGGMVSDELSHALNSENVLDRKTATQILGEIGDINSVTLIVAMFEDVDREVRTTASQALVKIGETAIPDLIKALGHSDRFVRHLAVRTLGELEAKASVTHVIELLNDSDSDVQSAAANCLGKLQDSRAIPKLVETLRTSNWDIRRSTRVALVKFGAEVVPVLIELLEDGEKHVKDSAAEALGEIGDPRAITPLTNALQNCDNFDTRWTLVESLGNIGGNTVIPPLLEAIQDSSSHVRQAAITALGQIENSSIVPDIAGYLEDSDEDVRRATVKSLEKINTPEALEALKSWRTSG